MPGNNTTGTPNTEDYNLGRGIIYFGEKNANGTFKPWRDLGNAPAFTVTTDSETLQHFSSRTGLKTLDREVTLSRTMNLGFTVDEWNNENLAMAFSGDSAAPVNAAVAGFAKYELVPAGSLEGGRWYDVQNSAGLKAYDVLSANLTVSTSAAITLIEGTDYTLDTEMGMFFLISTATRVITAVNAGNALDIVVSARAGARAVQSIEALSKTEVKGRLLFISSNAAANGFKRRFYFRQVTLKTEGDLSMIGDDWGAMQFTGAAEQDTLGATLTISNVKPAVV